MLAADDRLVGVVVEVDQLRPPADPDRLARGEHDADRGLQALRPGRRRPERSVRPVIGCGSARPARRRRRGTTGQDLRRHSGDRRCPSSSSGRSSAKGSTSKTGARILQTIALKVKQRYGAVPDQRRPIRKVSTTRPRQPLRSPSHRPPHRYLDMRRKPAIDTMPARTNRTIRSERRRVIATPAAAPTRAAAA